MLDNETDIESLLKNYLDDLEEALTLDQVPILKYYSKIYSYLLQNSDMGRILITEILHSINITVRHVLSYEEEILLEKIAEKHAKRIKSLYDNLLSNNDLQEIADDMTLLYCKSLKIDI